MNLLKRSLLICLSIVGLFSLVSCGENPVVDPNAPKAVPTYPSHAAGRRQLVVDTFKTEDVVGITSSPTYYYIVRAIDGSIWYVYVSGDFSFSIKQKDRIMGPTLPVSGSLEAIK